MSAERHFGFEIENMIRKRNDPEAQISASMDSSRLSLDKNSYSLDPYTLESTDTPLRCDLIYTWLSTFELRTPPFSGQEHIEPLLLEGIDILFYHVPFNYSPWLEFIVIDNGPPMRGDLFPIDTSMCDLRLYKFDISIELSEQEHAEIESQYLLRKFNVQFQYPSLSEVRRIKGIPVLHTAFDGEIPRSDLPMITQKHIHRVYSALER